MEETSKNNGTAQLGIGAVMLRDYLISKKEVINHTELKTYNRMANIYEITKDLERSRSWYFKAAKKLEKYDKNFCRIALTDLCFYNAT